jgi:putative membrane protein
MCVWLVIFGTIFLLLGIYAAKRRNREIWYGNANKYKLANVIINDKNLITLKKYITIKNEKKMLNFNSIPKKKNIKLYDSTIKMYPYDPKFNWYKENKQITISDDVSDIN